MAREYCERCRIALEEWEWCGRGLCEACEDEAAAGKVTDSEAREVLSAALDLVLGKRHPKLERLAMLLHELSE
jgi:hypothetical protein